MTEDEVRTVVREEIRQVLSDLAEGADSETGYESDIIETTSARIFSRIANRAVSCLDDRESPFSKENWS